MCEGSKVRANIRIYPDDGGSLTTFVSPKGRGLLLSEISVHGFENEKFTKETDSILDPLILS